MTFGLPGVPTTNDESLDIRLMAPAAGNARRTFGWIDLAVLALLAGFIYALVTISNTLGLRKVAL